MGQSPSGEISFHNYFSNAIKIIVVVVVECCCILIINYCWQASSAYLSPGLRRMTSFVKIFRSVDVERLGAEAGRFVVGAFSLIRARSFSAPARCLRGGRRWRLANSDFFIKNY